MVVLIALCGTLPRAERCLCQRRIVAPHGPYRHHAIPGRRAGRVAVVRKRPEHSARRRVESQADPGVPFEQVAGAASRYRERQVARKETNEYREPRRQSAAAVRFESRAPPCSDRA